MADKRISELTTLTGANSADDDLLVIVDSSASETKSITLGELEKALGERDFSFADDDKLVFGDGDDLQIYHDSATGHSIINEVGSGSLQLRGSNIQLKNADNTKNYIAMTDGGDVDIYYDNSLKLSTTSTGIDVTGTVTADGLTVLATSDNATIARFGGSSDVRSLVYSTANQDDGASNPNALHKFEVQSSVGQFKFSNTANDLLLLDHTGNVGIGTSSPLVPLHVSTSGTSTASGGNAAVTIRSEASGRSSTLQFSDSAVSTWVGQVAGSNINFGTGNSERMRIDSSGKVGIGTSNPASQLSLASTSSADYLRIDGPSSRSYFGYESGNTTIYAQDGSGGVSNLIFGVGSSSAEKMRIDSSGNLLVNATSQFGNNKFCVVGDDTIGLKGGSSTGAGSLKFYRADTGGIVWYISTNHTNFYIADSDFSNYAYLAQNPTAWQFASDRRLKENITDIDYGLESVMALQPRSFNFIGSEKSDIGFIAQELRDVIPEAVTGVEQEFSENDTPEEKANKILGVGKETLIPVLVKAIQEQQAQIELLKARIETLEGN